jgi:hypothetical protein
MLIRYGGSRRHGRHHCRRDGREADQRCQACQDESPESHGSPSIADFSIGVSRRVSTRHTGVPAPHVANVNLKAECSRSSFPSEAFTFRPTA